MTSAIVLGGSRGIGKQYGSGHFRLVYLPSLEVLDSAMNKIEDFVS